MKRDTLRVFVTFLIGFFACAGQVFGATDGIYRFRPGIHLSRDHQFDNEQLDILLQGFRFWTGLTEIASDRDGNIVLGDRTHLRGGSKTARELIIAAVDGSDSFTLQSVNNSRTIAFAQIESEDRYIDGQGARHWRWELRIDFSDFSQLIGADNARVAFDPAISAIHELAHAIRGYVDLISANDRLGECERYINTMRAELGLPQRIHYYPRYSVATQLDGLTFVQGELRFTEANLDKSKEVYVTFNVDKIFDRSNARSKAEVLNNIVSRGRSH